jgi:hypothetical protein
LNELLGGIWRAMVIGNPGAFAKALVCALDRPED